MLFIIGYTHTKDASNDSLFDSIAHKLLKVRKVVKWFKKTLHAIIRKLI